MADEPRTYAIFGGTGGIGRAVARRLIAGGHRVALIARRGEVLEAAASELGCRWKAADAGDFEAAASALTACAAEMGGLDGVAHCVGSLLLKPAHLTTRAEWDAVVTQNLTSAFSVLRGAVGVMPQGGSVVFVSTAAAHVGLPSHEAIAASKAGVEGLVRSAAATYGAKGVRVNAVAPGLVETPMTERITRNEASRKASEAMHALGRIGKPEDIASAIAWLLAPEQSWVTGQIIGVDGGLAAVRTKAGK